MLESTWHLVPHIVYQQLMYPVTGISVTRNNHATRIYEYTFNNKTCNMNDDPYDKNIETIHACVTVMWKHDITVYRVSM